MEQHYDDMNNSENYSYKDKRRIEAKEKRHKDQMSVTIFGIFIYSVVLIAVVVAAYVGLKSVIVKQQEKIAIQAEEEAQRIEAEKKELEEKKKAEEEAKAAALLEEQKKAAEEEERKSGYKDAVFSVIENVSEPGNALVNTFDFTRKSLDAEEKLMDYEVYKNPETSEISKVTTRENCGDLFEITDYYFNNGKINYIAQYREDTDIPVDLSTDKIESRLYFDKDKMVKYIYCENDRAVEYSVEDFDLYSEGTIEQYKYMEDMMLASSRTAYKNASEVEEKVTIKGYVLDELNNTISEPAKVQLIDSNERVVEETETNGDGLYSFSIKPNDNSEYYLYITGRDDMISTQVYGVKPKRGTKEINIDTVYLAYSSYDTVYPVQIFVKDADDSNTAIAGADIKFRYGFNNRDGEIFLTGVLGDAGEIMPTLRSGNYTIEISKTGYETSYVPFSVKGNHTAIVAFSVKDVAAGNYKCVLSFETTPLDIDLRAFDTYGRNVMKSVVDSVGITMAETIALSGVDSGTYTFYASNYTDSASSDLMSYRLSQSGAKIYVYDGDGLQDIIPVPAGHAGVVWRPFEIRNHRIITINDYYAYIVDNSIFRNK